MDQRPDDIITRGKWGKKIDDAVRSLRRTFQKAAQGIQEFTLDNGMYVVCETDFSKDTIQFAVTIKSGMNHSPSDLPDLAHMAEHMALHARGEHAVNFAQRYQRAGAEFHGTTMPNHTSYYGSVPWTRQQEDRTVGILHEMLQTPIVNQTFFEGEKTVMETELMRKENHIFHKHLQASGRMTHSDTDQEIRATFRKARLEDIQDFFDTHYRPENMILALSGPITASMLKKLLERQNSDARDVPQTAQPKISHTPSGYHIDHKDGRDGVDITIGFDTDYLQDPREMATAIVAERYLSQMALTELRANRNISYHAQACRIESFSAGGFLLHSGTIHAQNAVDAIEGFAQVLNETITSVDPEILEFATRQNEPQFSHAIRPYTNRSLYLAECRALDVTDATFHDLAPHIRAVTAQDLQTFIRENFFEKPLIYTASGNCDHVPGYEEVHEIMGRDIIPVTPEPAGTDISFSDDTKDTMGLPAAHS